MVHALVPQLLLAALPCQVGDAQDSSSVLRVHDLSGCAPIVETQEGTAIPAVRSRHDTGGMSAAVRSREMCLEVIQSLQPEQWEVAERGFELDSSDRLLVMAPPALQESVAVALELMADTFGRETRLAVDLVTLDTADAETLPALVSADEVARRIATASASESHEIGALPGARAWLQALRTLETVPRYGVNIAERSASFRAELERASTGLAVECAVTPAPGGWWLAMNAQDVRLVGEVQDVELRQEAHFTTDTSIISTRGPGRYQPLRLDQLTCSVNTYVPDGKALVVRAATESGRGTTRVLFVRPLSAPAGAITRPPASRAGAWGGRSVAFVRTDAYALPRAQLGESPLRSLTDWADEQDERRYAIPSLESHSADELIGRLHADDVTLVHEGAWAVLIGNDRSTLDAQLARVSPLLPEPRVLSVRLTLRRNGGGAMPLARAVVAVRAGARSSIVLGQEITVLRSTESEVAQGASVVFPQVSATFEGLAVSIDPRTTGSGGLFVAVEAHGRAAHGPLRVFDAGTSIPPLHQQDADVLDVERSLTFPESDATPRRIVLGNSGPRAGALTLEIEIADVR